MYIYIYIFRFFDNLIYFDIWVRSSAGLRLVCVSRVSQVSKSQNQLTWGLFSGFSSWVCSALKCSDSVGLDFRCIQNLRDLFCILMINGNRPYSALHALLNVLLCNFIIILQNSVCRASVGYLSHLVITEWTPYLTSIQRYGLNYTIKDFTPNWNW